MQRVGKLVVCGGGAAGVGVRVGRGVGVACSGSQECRERDTGVVRCPSGMVAWPCYSVCGAHSSHRHLYGRVPPVKLPNANFMEIRARVDGEKS